MHKFLLLALLILSSSFANSVAGKRVLISLTKTPYKEALAQKIATLVENKGVVVKKIAQKKLRHEDESTYDAIIILDDLRSSKVNGVASKLYQKSTSKEKIIIFATVDKSWGGVWEKASGVDGISGASGKENFTKDLKKILQKLQTALL